MSGNRYATALARGRREYECLVEEDSQLLKKYGLRLLSVEGGGIRAAVEGELRGSKINPWNVIEINLKAWNWIRPLLLRLSLQDAGIEQVRDVLLRGDGVSNPDHDGREPECPPESA